MRSISIPSPPSFLSSSTSAGIAAELGKQKNVFLQTTSGTIEVSGETEAEALCLGTTSGAIGVEHLTAESLSADTT